MKLYLKIGTNSALWGYTKSSVPPKIGELFDVHAPGDPQNTGAEQQLLVREIRDVGGETLYVCERW